MGEVLVTEPDSYVSALLLLFAIAPCWSLDRKQCVISPRADEDRVKRLSFLMTWRIRWCHFPRRPLLHLALCRHIDGLHAFHDSVELTKSHSEEWKWRRGRFTFVLYHIWDKSDLLENSRRADFYWRSWNRLQVSDDPGVHTGGRYSGVGFILESSLVILETPSVTKHQAVPGCSDVTLCLTPCYSQSDHCHSFINQN